MHTWNPTRFYFTFALTVTLALLPAPYGSATESPGAHTGPQVSSMQTLLGDEVSDTPEVIFEGNFHLEFSRDLLERFFHCLCDNTTTECFLTYTTDSDSSPSYYTHHVTRVESLRDLQVSDARQASATYTCQTPTPGNVMTLPCQMVGSPDSEDLDPAIQAAEFHDSCNFKCVRIQWTSSARYSGFGRGPSAGDSRFCVPPPRLGVGKDDSEEDTVKRDTNPSKTDDKDAVTAEDVRNSTSTLDGNSASGNASGERMVVGDPQLGGNDDVEEGECICGNSRNGDSLFLGIAFAISLVVNVAFLVLLTYLWLGIKRKDTRHLSPLDDQFSPPVGGHTRPRQPGQNGPPFRGSINMTYQNMDELGEEIETTLTPGNLKPIPDEAAEVNSNDYVDGAGDELSRNGDAVGGNLYEPPSPVTSLSRATPTAPVAGGVFVGFIPTTTAGARKPQLLSRSISEEPYRSAGAETSNHYDRADGETHLKTAVSVKANTRTAYRPRLHTPSKEALGRKDLTSTKVPPVHRDGNASNEATAGEGREEYENVNFSQSDNATVKPQPRKPRRNTRGASESSESSQPASDTEQPSVPSPQKRPSKDSDNVYEDIAGLGQQEGLARSNSLSSDTADDHTHEKGEHSPVYANMPKRPWF